MSEVNSMDLPGTGTRSESEVPRKSRWWLWLFVLAAVAVAGFWYFHERSTSQAQNSAQGAPGVPGRGGRGGPGGNFVVPVVVASAQRGDLPVYFEGLGTVNAFNTVTVRSRVDGQIVKINFVEGQFVRQGESLMEIDPRPFQVQLDQAAGQLAKDEAQLHNAQVDYERFQLLYKEGVIPKQQLDTQQSQVGQFEGSIKADEAQVNNAKLQLTYAHVTAPISGRVGLRLVDIGNIIHASDSNGLLVITQLQPISVIFSLPQDQLPQVVAKLRSGTQLSVDAFDRENMNKIATGKLLTIDNQIDPTTGTYKLKSVFDNENNILFPNQFVNIHLLVDVKRGLTVIPVPAIQRGPQGTYVYVVENGNTAKIHPITVTQTTGNNVGVSGVNPGDMVVVDGQDKLQDGSKVTPSSASPAGGSANAQNTNGGSQPSSQPGNTQAGEQHHRRPQAGEQSHSSGQPQ